MIAAIPLRDFQSAKSRLADEVPAEHRARVAAAVAGRVAAACAGAGWKVVVVSSASDVTAWCRARRLETLPDPGAGLDAAATRAISGVAGPWMVVHGDLPLITPADLDGIAAAAHRGSVVLAPSRDGGTNLIAATGGFRFAYGPGSFARHVAAAARRVPLIVVRTGLAVELDTPADLAATVRRPDGRWLAEFLS